MKLPQMGKAETDLAYPKGFIYEYFEIVQKPEL